MGQRLKFPCQCVSVDIYFCHSDENKLFASFDPNSKIAFDIDSYKGQFSVNDLLVGNMNTTKNNSLIFFLFLSSTNPLSSNKSVLFHFDTHSHTRAIYLSVNEVTIRGWT